MGMLASGGGVTGFGGRGAAFERGRALCGGIEADPGRDRGGVEADMAAAVGGVQHQRAADQQRLRDQQGQGGLGVQHLGQHLAALDARRCAVEPFGHGQRREEFEQGLGCPVRGQQVAPLQRVAGGLERGALARVAAAVRLLKKNDVGQGGLWLGMGWRAGRSRRRHSTLAAMSSALKSSWVRRLASAPSASSWRNTAALPLLAAYISAVAPVVLVWSIGTPARTRRSIPERSPCTQASQSALLPSRLTASSVTPWWISALTMAASPRQAASIRGGVRGGAGGGGGGAAGAGAFCAATQAAWPPIRSLTSVKPKSANICAQDW